MRNLSRITVVMALLFVHGACARENAQVAKPAPKRAVKAKHAAPAPKPGEVGAPMPDYKAVWLSGKEFDLASQRGQVVFLNLWATWCGPCRFEIPELQDLHEKYAKDGFEVIGVSLDDTGADDVKKFIVSQKKMTYPIVIDADGRLANIFQTSVVPTSAVIDRSGKVVWKHMGAVSAGDTSLKKAIEAALAAKS